MGLDMYLEGRTFNWTDWDHPEKNPMRDGYKVKGLTLELGYWRKHPNLHGYIVQTFAGGLDNCQDIYLNADQIQQIIDAIKKKQLPFTEGFFFGESLPEYDQESIEILQNALKWLQTNVVDEKGRAVESRDVVYRASW